MFQQRKCPNAFQITAILLLLALLIATVASVPTSVLAQNSELNDIESLNQLKLKSNNFLAKVKRSSEKPKDGEKDTKTKSATVVPPANNGLEKKSSPEVVPASFNAPPPQQQSSKSIVSDSMAYSSLPTNSDLINTAIAAGLTAAAVEAAATANQRDQTQLYEAEEAPPAQLHKRGINLAQQKYPLINDDAYYTNPYLTAASLPSDGVWADELDPAIGYAQLQDLDDYMTPIQRPISYRPRAFDSLQSLNAETYLEPLPYGSRYYGPDRSKRSNANKYNRYAELREKLTPADMLALVALVEAGERDRKDTAVPVNDDEPLYNPRSLYGSNVGAYDYPAASIDEDIDENFNGGVEPANLLDYYGKPVNFETLPKYEITAPREHKYGARNRFAVKRFMVAKKSRPFGKFLNEPVAKPSITFTSNGDQYY